MSDFLTTGLPTAVQKKIEELVLQGKLQGGDKLNEVELAEMFGTSRGPIREACKGLRKLACSPLFRIEVYSSVKWICVKCLRYMTFGRSLIS